MDYPSSEPAATPAFIFGADGEAQSSADPTIGPFFFNFDPLSTPNSDHRVDAAADPSPGPALGPHTCASQAVRPLPFTTTRTNEAFGQFHLGNSTWPISAAQETGLPVPPSAWSGIARVHAANQTTRSVPRARTSSTGHPTSNPSVGILPTGSTDLLNWGGFTLPNSRPSVACPPPPPTISAFLRSSLASGLPHEALSDPSLHSPASRPLPIPISACSEQTPLSFAEYSPLALRSPDFNTAFDPFSALSDDGSLGLPSIDCSTPSFSEAQYPISPPAEANEDTLSNDNDQGPFQVFADTALSGAVALDSPSQGSGLSKGVTENAQSLSIVQYKPGGGKGAKQSRKRSALEDLSPQGIVSQTLRRVSLEGKNGEVQGTMITFGKRIKTRAVFTKEKREQTAQARREGVCGRCRRSKRQCDLAQKDSPYVSCTLCACTKLYKNVPRMPCFKSTLADILFFRSGPAPNEPFFTRRPTIYDLTDLSKPNVEVRTLTLTQHVGSHRLTVYASEFNPVPEDVISYKWRDSSGNPHELKMPTFSLTNLEKINTHIRQYIDSAKWSYLAGLKAENELTWMTAAMAVQYAKGRPDSLVVDVLNLWAISRMIEIPWEMCGSDTLGLSRIDDADSPHHGKIPIPPNMDTQLDQIVIQHFLNPLRARLLQKLEQRITPPKPETWFEMYLSAFVLLNHIERLARHSVSHAKLHTMRTKYSNTPFLEAAFHTAKSILARFHFVCNGSAPLRLDWESPKTVAMARLEPGEVRFMKRTQEMVAARENDVRSLRGTYNYEYPLYWSGQLFFEDFDTSPVCVVEEVEGVEDTPPPSRVKTET